MEYVKLESYDGIRAPNIFKFIPIYPRNTHKSSGSSNSKVNLKAPSLSRKGKN